MDNRTLSKEQLKQLVKFIHSRGFREHVVVLEILDHFACKVEEVLDMSPQITLDEAIKKAHASFGVMGFQPIAASFYEQTRKKYSRVFWKIYRRLILKPVSLLLLSLIALLYYNVYMWADRMHYWHIFNINDTIIGVLLLYIGFDLYLLRNLSKSDRKHPFISYSIASGRIFWLTGFMYGTMDNVHNPAYTWIPAMFYTLCLLYIITRFIATIQTIRKAKQDIAAIERMTAA